MKIELLVECTKDRKTILVTLEENLVSAVAQEIRRELLALTWDEPMCLILDLTHVDMIDSVGLSVFIALHRKIGEKGGEMMIRNPSNDIRNFFKTMNLHRHFTIL